MERAADLALLSAATICGIGTFEPYWFTNSYLGDPNGGGWFTFGGALFLGSVLLVRGAAVSAREEPDDEEAVARRAAEKRAATEAKVAALREQLPWARQAGPEE